MKKNNLTILKTTLNIAAFAVVFSISSCNENMNSKETKDTKEIAEDRNEAKLNEIKEDDSEYLVAAAEINLEEIQLGQLAQKNSTTPRVIELGKMMEIEHAQALKELQVLATKKKMIIPTAITNDGKDANDKLKNVFGTDFDKQYSDMMVKGHKDAISKFEKASTDANDAEVRSWATKLVTSLKVHLAHSVACQEECSKMKKKS